MERNCVVCGELYESPTRTKTCSPECKLKHKRTSVKIWSKANPDKVALTRKKTQLIRIANGSSKTYQAARRCTKAGYLDRFLERARCMNPSTDITRDYLDQIFGSTCAVSNVPFRLDRPGGQTSFENPYSPLIDRIDSTLPYQVGNVQIVLSAINFAKNAMTMEDFTNVWRDIVSSWAALTKGHY